MKATDILRSEHDKILKVITLLQQYCFDIKAQKTIDRTHLSLIIEFIQVFADRSHHAKEEKTLFPKMIEKGFPSGHSPITVMLQEHDLGRSHILKMKEVFPEFLKEEPQATSCFLNEAFEFSSLLQQHIMKENMILFQMADNILDDAAQAEILARFEQINNEILTPEFQANILNPVQEMVNNLGNPDTIFSSEA
ncbi:MAG: hypothetical protein ACD_73C00060G0004 [uncultured bacterium]|nr:MAG: hypothetical protein ACD_73C00060G0004 [uncultured bacterium]